MKLKEAFPIAENGLHDRSKIHRGTHVRHCDHPDVKTVCRIYPLRFEIRIECPESPMFPRVSQFAANPQPVRFLLHVKPEFSYPGTSVLKRLSNEGVHPIAETPSSQGAVQRQILETRVIRVPHLPKTINVPPEHVQEASRANYIKCARRHVHWRYLRDAVRAPDHNGDIRCEI